MKYILIFLFTANTFCLSAKNLADSLYKYSFKIHLIDYIGGKYKIYYKGKIIHKFNSRHKLLDTILTKIDTCTINNIDNHGVPLQIYKKNFWSLYYSDIDLYIYYIRGYSYFTIISDKRVKNRYRFVSFVSNYRYEVLKID